MFKLNMKKLTIAIALSISLVTSSLSFANSDIDTTQLEAVITAKIAATTKESESIEEMMKTMHSGSPVALGMKIRMEQNFPTADVNTSLVNFTFIGQAGNYAMAKIKQRVEKVTGLIQLKDHESEKLIVFKQEEGQWKIWQTSVLDMVYL